LLKMAEKYRRLLADFENYKKQVAKQNEEFKQYALENFILDILPVLDNFQASLEHIPEDAKENGWVTGILYIHKQLLDVLAQHRVEPLRVKPGDKFDVRLHEAMATQEDINNKQKIHDVGEKEKGTSENKKKKSTTVRQESEKIKKILKDGYRLGEKIIRPALVEVG